MNGEAPFELRVSSEPRSDARSLADAHLQGAFCKGADGEGSSAANLFPEFQFVKPGSSSKGLDGATAAAHSAAGADCRSVQ